MPPCVCQSRGSLDHSHCRSRRRESLRRRGKPRVPCHHSRLGLRCNHHRHRQLSAGQQQRIGIARALSMQPDVVVADESVSALDLSVQKQVLRLMNDLQSKYKMAMIFITHDLRVAAQISDYIAVMEKGSIV